MQQRISMRPRCARLALAIVFVAAALVARQSPADDSEDSANQALTAADGWLTDFAQAAAEAERLDVPLLVHFYAEWCIPCKRMQREVLNDRELLEQLGKNFVGVKVNIDANEELARRLNIRSLPADVVFAPDGRILAQTGGYQPRSVYLLNLSLAHSKFTEPQRAAQPSFDIEPDSESPALRSESPAPSTSHPSPGGSGAGGEGRRPLADENKNQGEERPLIVARPTTRTRQITGGPAPVVAAPKPLVGLDGYSPVALFYRRKWQVGSPQFAAVHKGIQYRMLSADELEQFRADPERFAPRLLGCDPVVLAETDRALTGNTRHAAYFDDALYLFVSAESRARFKQNPLRYTTLRHVLLDEQEAQTRRR